MRSVYEQRLAEATEIQRKLLQGDAILCSPAFGRACKGVWPTKTAEMLASVAGCSVRAAAYQLSGDSDPSMECLYALFTVIVESAKGKKNERCRPRHDASQPDRPRVEGVARRKIIR